MISWKSLSAAYEGSSEQTVVGQGAEQCESTFQTAKAARAVFIVKDIGQQFRICVTSPAQFRRTS